MRVIKTSLTLCIAFLHPAAVSWLIRANELMADAEALCGEPKASQNILLGITVGEVKAVVGLYTLDRNSLAPVSLGHLPDEPHTEKTFRAAAVTSVSQIIPQFRQLQIQISTHIVPPRCMLAGILMGLVSDYSIPSLRFFGSRCMTGLCYTPGLLDPRGISLCI